MKHIRNILAVVALIPAAPTAASPAPSPRSLIDQAVAQILPLQESDGSWPYEGVYRVDGEIPIGYRIGGTAVVCQALLHATSIENETARTAVERGLDYVLGALADPLAAPSTADRYDVRIWGQTYALGLLCEVRAAGREGSRKTTIDASITKLVEALLAEEIEGGGWNYANRRVHAPFVTAPVVQVLLLARAQGEIVPASVLERCRGVLTASRLPTGAFHYSGTRKSTRSDDRRGLIPGSIARSPLCESTLKLLGGGSTQAVLASLGHFHQHWEELEKRRRQSGTHAGEYGIAPYYFYFGHRYAAQAIELLPQESRASERLRLLEAILRTRDADGTWNDRVFPRSRSFGTAMMILALLADGVPMPPALPAAMPDQRVEPPAPNP